MKKGFLVSEYPNEKNSNTCGIGINNKNLSGALV